MKKRIVKKWASPFYIPFYKSVNYANHCYSKLKQYFPFYLPYGVTITDWDKVDVYLGNKKINEKENLCSQKR